MFPGLVLTPSASLRRRAHAPRRSAKLQLAFAQIGMALERRRGGAREETSQSLGGEEPSVVDCLLGVCRREV